MSGASPDPARWGRIEEICFEAMARTGDARRVLLDERCAGEPELRTAVEGLLRASEDRPTFLERPIVTFDTVGHEAWASPGGDMDEDDPATRAPDRVGPYRVVRPLGHGGMGVVYLAMLEREDFSRPVALKVIRPGFDSQRVLERFRSERRMLAELRHPNIASLLDGGLSDEGRPWFAMEFVEGRPIDAYCDARGASVRERVDLVRTLCSALHHAHQNLVVHRDIKPGNVLVTEDGIPKLLDFGIGKLLDAEGRSATEETVVEECALTPQYAAPEQLDGGPITTATDVFGLGVLLYRLLAGALPYSDTADRTAARQLRSHRPARPSSGAVGGRRVPRELDAVVFRALAEEPGDRYAGPMALAEDLGRWLSGRPVRARQPSLVYSTRKFIARNRMGVSAGTLLAAGLLAGGVYSVQQSRRVEAERDKALEVRGFLLETFGAAGPDRSAGDPVTARALLDRQAENVEEAYADNPELRAEMMTVLGEGYERLGLYAEAEEWARRAVAEGAQVSDQVVLAATTLLGWILHQQGNPQEAEEVLVEAVAGARRAAGSERTLARGLNDLGVVQEALGDYDGAAAAHREAMVLRAELFGPGHRSVGISASNLSAVHYRQGDLEAAVREGERALDLIRGAFGPDHQRSVIVQSNLAVFKIVQGDLDGAEADYRDLLARQTRLQGREHPVTVRVMMSLATVLRRGEKWEESEAVLREALRIQNAVDEPNPVDVSYTMSALGDVLSAGGRHADGVRLIQDALDLQRDVLGPIHVDVAQSESYLVTAFERVDSIGRAVEWQERVLATLLSALGDEHPQIAGARERLTSLRERAGLPR